MEKNLKCVSLNLLERNEKDIKNIIDKYNKKISDFLKTNLNIKFTFRNKFN